MQQEKDLSLIFWIALSALFGLSTSSIIAIKKDSTVGQTLLAAALGCILAASSPFVFMALGLHLAWAVPAGAIIGLVIFGIFAWADVAERKMPNINVWDVWRGLPFPGRPSTPQAPTIVPPTDNGQKQGE